ncbi:MAG: threonine aldolase [Kineosporiaceae bacterium]|nr:threonine aldolase [Kineosporiaceae bacterium]
MSNPPSLASDNYASVHPEVMAALAAANIGHATPYGADDVTARAVAAMQAELGSQAGIAFVFNGTGANVVGLQLMLRPWDHVVCAATAHIAVDECGAPERITGAKLIAVPTPDGKLTPALVRGVRTRLGDEHQTQPRVVSVSQSTEYGTLYTPIELRALADAAHEDGMYLHVDGARIANAAAALGVSLAELTVGAGVDVMSFGATKNGAMGAEAVVVFAEELRPSLRFVRKQFMQLGSKGRFLSAQFLALFTDELWRRNALHANEMAARLHDGLVGLPGVRVTRPREANHVFVTLPREVVESLQQVAMFYVWDEATTEVRLLCSWDTTVELVDEFIAAARKLLA